MSKEKKVWIIVLSVLAALVLIAGTAVGVFAYRWQQNDFTLELTMHGDEEVTIEYGDSYTDADPYNYYKRSREHYMIHPETDRLLKRLLIILRDYGEETAFRYIRKKILKNL